MTLGSVPRSSSSLPPRGDRDRRETSLSGSFRSPKTSARAEQPYSFAATPGKLPKTVVPIHYAIDLRPDLEKLTLAGSEVVDIEVAEPTESTFTEPA